MLFDFIPNWRERVQTTREFRTDIWESRAGREQRRALRETPRQTVEMNVVLHNGTIRKFERLMAKNQNAIWTLPDYTRSIETDGMEAGDTIELPAVPAWVAVGYPVVLRLPRTGAMYLFEVDSIDGNEVTFTEASAVDWPAGTLVHPALTGTFGEIPTRRHTSMVSVASVRFVVDPATGVSVPPPAASTTFNDREVFLLKPNWMDAVDLTFEHPIETVDFGYGRVAHFRPVPFSTRVWRAVYVGRDRAGVDAIEAHFDRMRGQRGEFYMPTWAEDIVPKTTTAKESKQIRVEGTEFAALYADDTVYRAVAVFWLDGSITFNAVDLIAPISDGIGQDSIIQCADAWPADIVPADILRISWLPVWRHATDLLTVEWLTDRVARVALSMKTLEDLGDDT